MQLLLLAVTGMSFAATLSAGTGRGVFWEGRGAVSVRSSSVDIIPCLMLCCVTISVLILVLSSIPETSDQPGPNQPVVPRLDLSDQSAGSLASAGFVPAVQPPAGWLRTTTASPGRWRQQQVDPYQTQCSLQNLAPSAESDSGPSSSRPAVDKQLRADVDKLKKSAPATDVKPSESDMKPEWVRVTEEGLRVRERVLKGRSSLSRSNDIDKFSTKQIDSHKDLHDDDGDRTGNSSKKIEKTMSKNTESRHGSPHKRKSKPAQKVVANIETTTTKKESCNAGVKSSFKVHHSTRNRAEGRSQDDVTAIDTRHAEMVMERIHSNSTVYSGNKRGNYPSADPFTFGKYPKTVSASSKNDLDYIVSSHSSVRSGVSRRVFVKERLLSSSTHDPDLDVTNRSSGSGYCICKDFISETIKLPIQQRLIAPVTVWPLTRLLL